MDTGSAKATTQAVHAQWGKAIRKARLNAGLTQIELAAMVDVEQNTISRMENGQAPSDQMKVRLCLALGKTLDDLFAWPIFTLNIAARDEERAAS